MADRSWSGPLYELKPCFFVIQIHQAKVDTALAVLQGTKQAYLNTG